MPSEWLPQLQAWETIVMIFQLMKQRVAPQLAIVDGADNRADEPVKGKMKRRKATELQSGSFSCKLGRRD